MVCGGDFLSASCDVASASLQSSQSAKVFFVNSRPAAKDEARRLYKHLVRYITLLLSDDVCYDMIDVYGKKIMKSVFKRGQQLCA